jgi:protocatechuate 3,4-dioxygenase beta subunit
VTEKTDLGLDRRKALKLLGAVAASGILINCGGGTTTSTTSTGTGTGTTSSDSTCTVTPEGEEGPYFVDDSASGYLRSDIRSNLDGSSVQVGVPLTLKITVVDNQNSCDPMSNVQIDIWHCNAEGIYSAESVENTSDQSWLRGYQLTNSSGLVTFTTVFPGWYEGRTTHIHLRLRSTYDSNDSGGGNTTQLFFDQTLSDSIYTSVAPYNSRGTDSTTNANDHVFTGETKGENLVALTGDSTNGYAGTCTISLPITAA